MNLSYTYTISLNSNIALAALLADFFLCFDCVRCSIYLATCTSPKIELFISIATSQYNVVMGLLTFIF